MTIISLLLVSALVFVFYIIGSSEKVAFLQTAMAVQENASMSKSRDSYFPNTELLGSDEMRVIALGTGTPNFRN